MKRASVRGLVCLVGFGALAAVLAPVLAQTQGAAQRSVPASADETAIEKAAHDFAQAYNRHDAKAIAGLFSADAEFVEQDGTTLSGRAAIETALADTFTENPKAAISITIDSIRMLTPQVAIERGATTWFPDGQTATSRSPYTAVHVKRDGRWLIAGGRALPGETLSPYEHLRQLEWLVGDWVDEGAESVVETSCRWAENKSFLLQDFAIKTKGTLTLKGTQRIGWDPTAKQFRSWTFDAQGGFAEAFWTNVGDRWVIRATGVRSDGSMASATRTLTPVAKDRVIVATTDGVAGSASLPPVEITMVRRPPQPKAAR
jgi:uncharacterized protein (TIGR02246 family)